MNILGTLLQAGVQKTAEGAQKKLARAAYEVARGVSVMARVKPKRNYRLELLPAWEDLTQREQEEWIAAAGDVLQNFIDR